MNNKGSAVVEMSIIGPVLIFVIFLIIDIMTVLINNGAALGNMYMVLYNKENYIQNTENTDVQDVLEENISENVEDTLCFISNLKVEVSIENTKGNNVIGNTESILKGKV
jgi:Flp pilus assembly protein TadG